MHVISKLCAKNIIPFPLVDFIILDIEVILYILLAEGEGFEPPRTFDPATVFKTDAIAISAILPMVDLGGVEPPYWMLHFGFSPRRIPSGPFLLVYVSASAKFYTIQTHIYTLSRTHFPFCNM